MSDLVVLGLKLGYLALLWLFIGFVANVVRTDLFGRKVPAVELAQAAVATTPTAWWRSTPASWPTTGAPGSLDGHSPVPS